MFGVQAKLASKSKRSSLCQTIRTRDRTKEPVRADRVGNNQGSNQSIGTMTLANLRNVRHRRAIGTATRTNRAVSDALLNIRIPAGEIFSFDLSGF